MSVSLTGWGRTAAVIAEERRFEDLAAITEGAALTRGLGRSYGDASLPVHGDIVANATLADRILAFDAERGVLRAEAGLSLLALSERLLGEGWFSPVAPGTQFVTLGGMVAADVHGKNHHRDGTFGQHVRRLRMRLADDRIVECSPTMESELLWATVGGMGLTGHILEVEIQLKRIPSPWIWQRCERITDLGRCLRRLREVGEEWPFTVAWVDCLARGAKFARSALLAGRWAEPEETARAFRPVTRRRAVPFDLPSGALCRPAVQLLNAVHLLTSREGEGIVHPEKFFWPLDKLTDWNRMYGRRGFIQWQCALPGDPDSGVVPRLFDLIARLEIPVYLCVLKDCGAAGDGLLSFPMPGYTVALDIPFRPTRTQVEVDRLNEFVIECGGRTYLAKDSHTRPEHFRALEPRLARWTEVRRRWDPEGRIRSAMSVRLMGDRL